MDAIMFSYFSSVNNNNVNGINWVEFRIQSNYWCIILFSFLNTKGNFSTHEIQQNIFLILLNSVSKMLLGGGGSRGPALIICHGARGMLIRLCVINYHNTTVHLLFNISFHSNTLSLIYKKIGTLGVHVSAQRNSIVVMKKISFTIISKHLYFKVTIQPTI
jgi:hypothetical protein